MLKQAVQQGREANDERRMMSDGDMKSWFPRSALNVHNSALCSWGYVEPLREARTPLADCFSILLGGGKFQRDAVNAVAESSRLRAVIEDMALVTAAAGTVHFGAGHEEFRIGARLHHLWIDRLPEAGPAGAAIEFMFR